MPPTVSIVIPAYNNEAFIRRTMESVLAQTYADLEVIVADHESNDGTLDILTSFTGDPRVRLLTTPAGGGAARNWNRVTAEATGTYLKLVCGDDIIYPECVADQVAAFVDGVDMVASRRDIVDADERPVLKGRGLPGLLGRHAGSHAIRSTVRGGTNVFGEPASVMFRRVALEAAGNWESSEHYLIDEASYIRVLARGDFVGLETTAGAFRISGNQWSVRLALSQADEAVAYHRKLAAGSPGLLTRLDLVIGNARARLNAVGRRVMYRWLADRMVKERE